MASFGSILAKQFKRPTVVILTTLAAVAGTSIGGTVLVTGLASSATDSEKVTALDNAIQKHRADETSPSSADKALWATRDNIMVPPPPPPVGTFNSKNGTYPPGSWRPGSVDSPFNRPIPATPKICTCSSSWVSNLRSGGAPNALHTNLSKRSPGSDYYKPTYWAADTDPLYTIAGTYQYHGQSLHLPDGAKSAGASDHHLTVIEQDGTHWGFWNANVDGASRQIKGASGSSPTTRRSRIDDKLITSGGVVPGATAGGFANIAGVIRAQEVDAGLINHALFFTSSKTSGGQIFPAAGGGDGGGGIVPEGARFQLDPAYSISGFPTWERPILKALQQYGMYLGDSSGAGSFALQIEGAGGYTSFGRDDPLAKYGNDLSLSNVDWSKLRVVDDR